MLYSLDHAYNSYLFSLDIKYNFLVSIKFLEVVQSDNIFITCFYTEGYSPLECLFQRCDFFTCKGSCDVHHMRVRRNEINFFVNPIECFFNRCKFLSVIREKLLYVKSLVNFITLQELVLNNR